MMKRISAFTAACLVTLAAFSVPAVAQDRWGNNSSRWSSGNPKAWAASARRMRNGVAQFYTAFGATRGQAVAAAEDRCPGPCNVVIAWQGCQYILESGPVSEMFESYRAAQRECQPGYGCVVHTRCTAGYE